jgi:hypothetical protein
MNRDEVREIVDEALARAPCCSHEDLRALMRECVSETFDRLGVDQAHPLEIQRDLAWVRDMRRASASARAKALAALVGLLVTAAAGAAWLGVRALLRGGP